VKISRERQFNLDEATYTEPEIMVRPASLKSKTSKGHEAHLIVEVADTSLTKDTGRKPRSVSANTG
jgi:hypothetical protein